MGPPGFERRASAEARLRLRSRRRTPRRRRRPEGCKHNNDLGLELRDRKPDASHLRIAYAFERQPFALADIEEVREPRSQPGIH